MPGAPEGMNRTAGAPAGTVDPRSPALQRELACCTIPAQYTPLCIWPVPPACAEGERPSPWPLSHLLVDYLHQRGTRRESSCPVPFMEGARVKALGVCTGPKHKMAPSVANTH
ncbi:unnamed protein product [Eretmochelys imbricata]